MEVIGFVLAMTVWFLLLIGNRVFSAELWRDVFEEILASVIDLKSFTFRSRFELVGTLLGLLLLLGYAVAPFIVIYAFIEKYA